MRYIYSIPKWSVINMPLRSVPIRSLAMRDVYRESSTKTILNTFVPYYNLLFLFYSGAAPLQLCYGLAVMAIDKGNGRSSQSGSVSFLDLRSCKGVYDQRRHRVKT